MYSSHISSQLNLTFSFIMRTQFAEIYKSIIYILLYIWWAFIWFIDENIFSCEQNFLYIFDSYLVWFGLNK